MIFVWLHGLIAAGGTTWKDPQNQQGDLQMNRMAKIAFAVLTLTGTLAAAAPASELDKVKFETNWLAQTEHGRFYQAVVDGTYEKYGLDVEIVQGGPQAANRALLMADKIDFYMNGNLLDSFSAVEQGIPLIEVTAIFQKDPQVLIAHPDQGLEKFEDLASLPTIFMGKDGSASYFQWM